MELFKTFLADTSGKHLFNFWLDAERYKESLESEPEDTLREQMTRLFRWAWQFDGVNEGMLIFFLL